MGGHFLLLLKEKEIILPNFVILFHTVCLYNNAIRHPAAFVLEIREKFAQVAP